MKPLSRHHTLMAVTLFVLTALAVLEINDSAWLPGAHADSVEYMEAGESLAEGNGLQIPFASWAESDSVSMLSHFPPGMSFAIGGIMKVSGVRKHVAALWTLCFAAGLTVALSFLIGVSTTGWAGGFTAAALVAAMPPFVLAHMSVWSEPLYLALLLLTLFFMLRRPEQPWVAGTVAAAGVLVRYLGVATVAALGAWTWHRTRDLRKTCLAVLPGVFVFGSWNLWTLAHGESVRTLGEYTTDLGATFAQIPVALEFWLAPGLGLIAALVLMGALGWALVRAPHSLTVPVAWLVGAHLAVLLSSKLIVDARIPFDERILLPVFALLMLPAASMLARYRSVGAALACAWVAWVGFEDGAGVHSVQEQGMFYSSPTWMTSDLIFWVDNRMSDMQLYSNEPAMLYFLAERTSRSLPLVTHDFDTFARRWTARPGPIILVSPLRPDETATERYLETLDVTVVHESSLGTVLFPTEDVPEELINLIPNSKA